MDNGKEFRGRLFGLLKRAAVGEHASDKFCAELGIENRLTLPRLPHVNDMLERFNCRIKEVLQSYNFRLDEKLGVTLHRYV